MMVDKFWNGKVRGLPLLIVLFIGAVFAKLANILTTFYARNGIGYCGRNAIINRGFKVRDPSNISFGENVFIDVGANFSAEIKDAKLNICNGVSIGKHCRIDFTGNVVIGENSHISDRVIIITHDHGYDYTSSPVGKTLVIGRNVFIGMDSIILHNVSYIGDNVVIGVGSIVTKDVQTNAIIAGNPAKVIKIR